MLISCKKIDNSSEKTESKNQIINDNSYSSRGGGSTYTWTNGNLLKLVLYGTGGFVQVDTTCVTCPADSLQLVEFPTYSPPVNSGGMLSFSSMNDYNLFIKAANLMEDLWRYTDVDYEETPQEVFHLGEESLNALDSVFGFQSLRAIYDLNEYNNHDWADTASLIVEEDDYQIVYNQNHEVKIGDKFYKNISNNIIAVVSNNNLLALDLLRVYGIFTDNPDVIFYNETTGLYESPSKQEGTGGTQGCPDFRLRSSAGLSSTYINPTSSRFTLNTSVLYNLVLPNFPGNYKNVKGQYTVDWGDGSAIEVFTGYMIIVNYFYHIYQYPAIGSITRNITVTCQLISQSNPSTGYNRLLQDCPSLPSVLFTSATTVTLDSYNYPNCLEGKIVRKFNTIEHYVNGTKYRAECKLEQVASKGGIIFNFRRPKVVATIVFAKFKNGRWKNTNSIGELKLILRGNVYRAYDCSDLFYTINQTKSKNKKKKIKFKILGIVGSSVYFPDNFHTQKMFPTAINADFLWKYNNGQGVIGNYNEVLKP